MIVRSIVIALFAATTVYACAGAPDTGVARTDYRSPLDRPQTAKAYSHFLVGRFAALTNDPREAAFNYAAALETIPGDRSVAERAVFAALLADDFEGAAEVAKTIGRDRETNVSLARLVTAVDRLRRNDPAAAVADLDGADFGPFNTMVAHNLAAWAELERGGLEAARGRLIENRTGDNLLDGVTLNMVGFLQLAAEQDDAALQTFDTVWTSGARLAVATEAHARLLAEHGETDRAITLLKDFAEDVGRNPGVTDLLERIEAGERIKAYRPTVRQGAALAVYAPAAALAAQTDGDLAGVYFAMALALDPQLDVARTLWGEALDDAGRRADAIDVLDRVPERSPFYATAQGQLAWVLRREGRNQEALETAIEALNHTSDRDLKVQLGDLFRSLDRHGEAARIFDQVITSDEAEGRRDWRLLFARGAARERMGNWPDAEVDLRAALAIAPDEPDVLNYLGYGLVDRGEHLDEALALIRRAVKKSPRNGQIVDSLGWAYYRLGRYEEAVRHLERAVELEPGDVVLNDHLGDAYWQVGRTLEARFQWSRALNLADGEDQTGELEAKLANGLVKTSEDLAEAGRSATSASR